MFVANMVILPCVAFQVSYSSKPRGFHVCFNMLQPMQALASGQRDPKLRPRGLGLWRFRV